jgi:hypothetical protein
MEGRGYILYAMLILGLSACNNSKHLVGSIWQVDERFYEQGEQVSELLSRGKNAIQFKEDSISVLHITVCYDEITKTASPCYRVAPIVEAEYKKDSIILYNPYTDAYFRMGIVRWKRKAYLELSTNQKGESIKLKYVNNVIVDTTSITSPIFSK